MMDGAPGIDHDGDRAAFDAPDFQAAYDGVIALIRVARGGYQDVLVETILDRADGSATMAEYGDRLFDRWLGFESGRWTPPPTPEPAPGRRYHGAN